MEQHNLVYKLIQFSAVCSTSLLLSCISKYFLTGQPLLIIAVGVLSLMAFWWLVRLYWLWVSPYKKHVTFCLLAAGAVNLLGFLM